MRDQLTYVQNAMTASLSLLRWRYYSIIGGFLGGTMVLLLNVSATIDVLWKILGALIGSLLFGLLFGFLGLISTRLVQMEQALRDRTDELHALINVRPLSGSVPLEYGNWAMDAQFALIVARHILLHRPRLVVECGSGSSTVLIARCLEQIGEAGRVISLDHDATFAALTRRLLQRSELDNTATVLTTPLRPRMINGQSLVWYDLDLSHLEGRIDLLVVDGPPGHALPDARYPAVPILKEHLADDVIIIMDDGHRFGERETAHRWADELGAKVINAGGSKGTLIINCASGK